MTYAPSDAEAYVVPGQGATAEALTFKYVDKQTAYMDEVGFFQVDDTTGKIGTLSPGDAGYAQAAISSSTTLVLYMPGADYAEVSSRLREAGQPEDLPCVIVSDATGPQQQIRWTTVAGLAEEAKLPAPALLIVGRVATHKIEEIAASTRLWRSGAPDCQSRNQPIS